MHSRIENRFGGNATEVIAIVFGVQCSVFGQYKSRMSIPPNNEHSAKLNTEHRTLNTQHRSPIAGVVLVFVRDSNPVGREVIVRLRPRMDASSHSQPDDHEQ